MPGIWPGTWSGQASVRGYPVSWGPGIRPSKRELTDTGTDKRYVRRDDKGRFKESDDVGRSLRQDLKKPAKTVVPPGQGDKGDQKKPKR